MTRHDCDPTICPVPTCNPWATVDPFADDYPDQAKAAAALQGALQDNTPFRQRPLAKQEDAGHNVLPRPGWHVTEQPLGPCPTCRQAVNAGDAVHTTTHTACHLGAAP